MVVEARSIAESVKYADDSGRVILSTYLDRNCGPRTVLEGDETLTTETLSEHFHRGIILVFAPHGDLATITRDHISSEELAQISSHNLRAHGMKMERFNGPYRMF